jgi:hypothetical protein
MYWVGIGGMMAGSLVATAGDAVLGFAAMALGFVAVGLDLHRLERRDEARQEAFEREMTRKYGEFWRKSGGGR